MAVKSFSEILMEMCDAYDAYIAPSTIRRDDSNFIYLLLKAIAKGYENVALADEALRGKFNPAVCSDADLDSLARIVGTARIEGTGSGLLVTCTNNGLAAVDLMAGMYNYASDATAVFSFSLASNRSIASGATVQFVAFTSVKGSFPVSAISVLPVTRDDLAAINPNLSFSCLDNSAQLGSRDENNIEFRKRILSDNSRQDTIKEMELALKNLPYLFDCKLLFNQGSSPITLDGIVIEPFHLLVLLNGDARDEIADIIASRGVYPTVEVVPTDVLHVYSDVFLDGEYPVYFARFGYQDYTVSVSYGYNTRLTNEATIEAAVESVLTDFRNATKHRPLVTEGEFYDAIRTVTVPSFTLLDVNLIAGGSVVPYVSVLQTRIPRLVEVTFDASVL